MGRREGRSTGKGPGAQKWGRQEVSGLHGVGCTHAAAAVLAVAVPKRLC